MADVPVRKLTAILQTESGRKAAPELLKEIIEEAEPPEADSPAETKLPWRETYTEPEPFIERRLSHRKSLPPSPPGRGTNDETLTTARAATGTASAAPPRNRGLGRWEEDDTYPEVIVRSGDMRVINCRDDIQWIVQRLSHGRWRADKFCRTRRGLLFWAGDIPALRDLPEWHP